MSSVDHYENFPVASWLCPRSIRPAVVALYHFARTADDLADEGDASPAERLEALTAYRADLDAAWEAPPATHATAGTRSSTSAHWPAVFQAVARERHRLQRPLLHDLLDAFVQDLHPPRYRDRAHLLDYCRRSANPVGRSLLALYGVQDAVSLQRSDAICSALQLINFWQDFTRDGPRGRLYVPQDDLDRHGVTAAEVLHCTDTPASRQLVAELCRWARQLMLDGAPLALTLPGRVGWELRFVVQGGLRILRKIERGGYNSLVTRPAIDARDLPWIVWHALTMRAAP